MDEINEAQDRLLKFKRDMEKLNLAPVRTEEYVSPLADANMVAKGVAASKNATPKNYMLDTVREKINTKEVLPQLSGMAHKEKIAALIAARKAAAGGVAGGLEKAGKVLGKGLKSIPLLGPAIGLATAFATNDASAAIPVVSDMDSTGPAKGSIESKIENGTATQDEIDQLFNRARR